jgi:hypothetical protein
MIKRKTRFEQVPLEIVKKIIEEKTQHEETSSQTHGTRLKDGKENGKRRGE